MGNLKFGRKKASVLDDVAVKILTWLKLSYTYFGQREESRDNVLCVCCRWGGELMAKLNLRVLRVENQ